MTSRLSLTANPHDFFRSQLQSALEKQNLQICHNTEYYLVNLLSNFIFASPEAIDKPLAFRLKDALEAPEELRPSIYKSLGDTSLYLAGIFQDSFNRKTYDIDYFIDMGTNAYSQLSDAVKRKPLLNYSSPETFTSLSSKFSDLVDTFALLSEGLNLNKGDDILSNYTRMIKTKSPRLIDKLKKEGIDPLLVDLKTKN